MSTWANERIDMTETLKAGGVIYLDRKPYLTIHEVFQRVCDDAGDAEDQDEATVIRGFKSVSLDRKGGADLIAEAIETAIENLIDAHEERLKRQWEMDRDGEEAA